ncbi:hypothetical protein LCM20_09810 [Halobacillus litoralis]|uniref:hypothetical protein n=1 Tax=Halobacillus litoralis TaxID=45668 RepID=UPI001CD4C5F1|nr:hypothetical protein [Halobacillus litoralis]MCA0970885.1 hypothetical protein [Halobacillus litoralis]
MKRIIGPASVVLAILLTACTPESAIDWQSTKEEAIKAGLTHEGEGKLLAVEEFKGETFAFYEHMGGVGTARIVEHNERYGWYRSHPYSDFQKEGDLSYTASGFNIETDGEEVAVLIGQAFDSSIEEMRMTGTDRERTLKVDEETGYFAAVYEGDGNSLEVVPVE